MHLFDLHSDTPYRLYYESRSLRDPGLQVSADALDAFEFLGQVFALFCRPELSDDEAYTAFFAMRKRLTEELRPYLGERFRPILAVEDARLLGKSSDRLAALAEAGVQILTLLWKGETVIGGAYDTEVGLSAVGKRALSDAFSLAIHPDASHASYRAFFDIAESAARHSRPFLATHSDSYSVCPHPRNLRDEQFLAIRDSGGLVGLCLCPAHLTERGEATVYDVLRHLEHFLSLGGEDTVAIGTDFDGIDNTPRGLRRSRDLHSLSDALVRHGYPSVLIQKLFCNNAEAFFGKYKNNRMYYELQKHQKHRT